MDKYKYKCEEQKLDIYDTLSGKSTIDATLLEPHNTAHQRNNRVRTLKLKKGF